MPPSEYTKRVRSESVNASEIIVCTKRRASLQYMGLDLSVGSKSGLMITSIGGSGDDLGGGGKMVGGGMILKSSCS